MTDATWRVVLYCLVGLCASLLVVGVVSGTLLRHLVQILPIIAAAGLVVRPRYLGAWAAMPIFLFWIVIVVLIWLFLLGLSRFASGHFTVIEIVCTFLMAGFSVVGVAKAWALGWSVRPAARIAMFMLFAALQFAAMWISFLKPIANR